MRNRRVVVPIAILALGVLGFAALMATRSGPEPEAEEAVVPLVRVITAAPRPVQLVVRAHGTVVPRTESQLVPQVSGEVEWVSPSLAVGSFFEPGEVLMRIDPADYDAAVATALAARDRAASALAKSRRERDRQARLSASSAASEARVDEAEDTFQAADATLREAQVTLESAKRDRTRTELHAVYAGRVREKRVDIGQFVSRGDSLADLYAIDYAEVPLPIPDRELAFLDIPHPYRAISQATPVVRPEVKLRAEFAGAAHEWTGVIVRTDATIDPRSRTVSVVARVDDPFGRTPEGPQVPLPVGLFVDAEIQGRHIERGVVLPGTALREGDHVYVVDDQGRLRFREVEVVRRRHDEFVVGNGLLEGDRVCVSPLRGAIDGMAVRTVPESDALAGHAP